MFVELGHQTTAHRFAWRFTYGAWPSDMCLHKCDNPSCVNPDHLFEGTHQDNMDDMVAKGRLVSSYSRKPRRYVPTVTAAEIAEIRRLVAEGARPSKIASRFRISVAGVCMLTVGQLSVPALRSKGASRGVR